MVKLTASEKLFIEKDYLPKLKSSEFYEEIYEDKEFGWIVGPFFCMGNDLENLVRNSLLEEFENIVVIGDNSSAVVARLLRKFKDKKIRSYVEENESVEKGKNALLNLNLEPHIYKYNEISELSIKDTCIISCCSITENERILNYLSKNSDFNSTLITYRYNPPGMTPTKKIGNGTFDWFIYQINSDTPCVDFKYDRLSVFIGSQRYCQLHAIFHSNLNIDNLLIQLDEELSNYVEIITNEKELFSGQKFSVQFKFNADINYKKVIKSGLIKFTNDSNNTYYIELNIISMPLIEPAFIRWGERSEIPNKYLIDFFKEASFHTMINWASYTMNFPKDYH